MMYALLTALGVALLFVVLYYREREKRIKAEVRSVVEGANAQAENAKKIVEEARRVYDGLKSSYDKLRSGQD